eukprot:s4518_g7.t1
MNMSQGPVRPRPGMSLFAAADGCFMTDNQIQFVQIQIAPGASVGSIVCQCGTRGGCTVSGPPSSSFSSCSQMDADGDDSGDDPCDPPSPPYTDFRRMNKKSKKDKKQRKDKKQKKNKMKKLSKAKKTKDNSTQTAQTSSANNDDGEIEGSLTNTSPARGTKRKNIGEGNGNSEVGGLGGQPGQLMITDGSVFGSVNGTSASAVEVPAHTEPEDPQQAPGIPFVQDNAPENPHEDPSAPGVLSVLVHAGAAGDGAAPSATPMPTPVPLSSELELASPSGCRRSRFNVSLNLPESSADGVNLD